MHDDAVPNNCACRQVGAARSLGRTSLSLTSRSPTLTPPTITTRSFCHSAPRRGAERQLLGAAIVTDRFAYGLILPRLYDEVIGRILELVAARRVTSQD